MDRLCPIEPGPVSFALLAHGSLSWECVPFSLRSRGTTPPGPWRIVQATRLGCPRLRVTWCPLNGGRAFPQSV